MFEVELESDHAAVARPALGAAVAGLGTALPERTVPNRPIAERIGVDEGWITERTGVVERRHSEPDETLAGYGARAAERALHDAGAVASEVDLVLAATMTHDRITPSAAALIAAELGAGAAGAIDVGSACTGFVSALALGAAQIESGRSKRALVVGVDLMSRIVDFDDRSTAGLFGDGAGAVVLEPSRGTGRVGPSVLGSDGGRGELVVAEREEAILRMKGHDTYRQAVDRLGEATTLALSRAGLEIADVDLFVYHQANSRIIKAVGERLDLPAERVVDSVPKYGNTSAASIPLALGEALAAERLSPGDKVLVAGFGGGLTWGAATLEWGHDEA